MLPIDAFFQYVFTFNFPSRQPLVYITFKQSITGDTFTLMTVDYHYQLIPLHCNANSLYYYIDECNSKWRGHHDIHCDGYELNPVFA